MPELPEVETVARGLRPKIVGETIQQVERFWSKALIPDNAIDDLVGRKIIEVDRRAKFIQIHLDEGVLLVHLRMTGRLTTLEPLEDQARRVTVRLAFQTGNSLYFMDTRKFGRMILAHRPEDALPDLGPEPLSRGFTGKRFLEMLKQRSRQIKPLLLDQAFLAGLGNIYADEVLLRARIHPLSTAASIPVENILALHRAIRKVLRDSIRYQGTTVLSFVHGDDESGSYQDQLRIYGHKDEPCPECGTPIEKITVGQRGTHFCPNCQVRYT